MQPQGGGGRNTYGECCIHGTNTIFGNAAICLFVAKIHFACTDYGAITDDLQWSICSPVRLVHFMQDISGAPHHAAKLKKILLHLDHNPAYCTK